MVPDTQTASGSRVTLRAGRIISALPALFLLVDGATKLLKSEPVVKAIQRRLPASRDRHGLFRRRLDASG
jgi:hypothetical protein